jgi:hypothetical protein
LGIVFGGLTSVPGFMFVLAGFPPPPQPSNMPSAQSARISAALFMPLYLSNNRKGARIDAFMVNKRQIGGELYLQTLATARKRLAGLRSLSGRCLPAAARD